LQKGRFSMKFNNRLYYLLIGTFVFFLLAKSLETICDTDERMSQYANVITENLQANEQKIALALKNQSFVSSILAGKEADLSTIQSLSKETFNICFYGQDSLRFWSNNTSAFPDSTLLKEINNYKKPILKKLSNGYFVIQKNTLPSFANSSAYAVSLIPIKWTYNESLIHLPSYYETAKKDHVPEVIEVVTKKTAFPINSQTQDALFYLDDTQPFKDKKILRWVMLFYLLAFLFLGLIINKVAKSFIKENKPWIGPAFLLIVVFGLRYISLDWTVKFEDFQVFERSFDNPHISVGDLLINIILLLWVVVFIHRESKDKDFSVSFTPGTRFFLTTMNYLSVLLALLLLISVLKSLVLNSGIDFDFKNVFSLDQYSVISVFGIILLLFTQFVFSHRMMITIHKLKLNRTKRLLALGLAILLALPIVIFINLEIPIHVTILLAFIFVISYDLFIDIPNPGLVWLSLWVILFSGFSSSLLYKYNLDKELNQEIYIAQKLAEDKDSLAEKSMLEFERALTNQLNKEKIGTFRQLNDLLATLTFNQNYLYTNYQYDLHQYDGLGNAIRENPTPAKMADWKELITKSNLITGATNIYLTNDSIGHNKYLLAQNMNGENGNPLVIQFEKASRKRSKVYTDLLSRQEFKGLTDLDKYNYLITKNGQPIIEEGISPEEPPFTQKDKPGIREYAIGNKKDLVYFMYRAAENDFIFLSKERNNRFHPVSLFSFIFTFLALMVVLIAVLNSKISILPDNLNFKFWNKPSLKNRIQFSTILLTLASFIIIAIVSFWFLTDSYQSYNAGRLNRKVSGVQTSAQQFLRQAKDSLLLLSEYVPDLALAERIDFNLYDLDGQLIQSSEMDIFNRGILPPKINAYAFEVLKRTGKSRSDPIDESISTENFTSVFASIKNSKGQKVAYIGVPYANQERTLQDDVLNFMGNLVNVYVFMLILAGGISVWVANTITRPITTIGENLKELKLGISNEPLQWRTNDEIGALVTEYNRMIVKLDQSAKLLARSEREGAWREMAKQVAHEIKNPLTPMKLSIQYLQHAFRSNPDNIEPLLKRVSITLIEQIDALAQIADEFSNFAKMPRANNQQIKLNDLVESVHDLFKESKNTDILLHLAEEQFYVFADKNHLMRVLNNMIKNAVEAIPDSRKGKIEVSLDREEEMAVIRVKDNGVGIPDDMKNRVFVPNFTTKNSGTGLGLAISKNIIESVSGKIYFETEKDVGTTFFVKLPIEDMVLEN